MEVVEVSAIADYGIMATVFVSKFAKGGFASFVLDVSSLDAIEFCVMTETGFFVPTGRRYQLVIPPAPTRHSCQARL
jgi:hypothetical protein